MPERQIKIRGFTYYTERGDGQLVASFAKQGETVDLRKEDVERGEKYDAFGDPSEIPEAPATAFNVVDASDDELDEYLESNSPNVDDTVALAGNDPESAQRLLDAENRVSDGSPRQGVEDGLSKIIEGDN